MMRRSCEACGRTFKAKTDRARFCSSTCRSRARRGAKVIALEGKADGEAPPEELLTLTAATRRQLEEAGRLETTAGAMAMVLAGKLERGGDTGSAVATLVRELRATMADALAGVPRAGDKVDELEAKREERRRLAGIG